MALFNPDINPIRFRKTTDEPDYFNRFPTIYNIQQRVQYQDGIWKTFFYKDWIKDKAINIQFEISGITNQDIIVYKWNETTMIFDSYTTLTKTDITPTTWVGNLINKYSFTPTVAGVYYMNFTEPGYDSDIFVVHDELKFKRKLIEIDYYNSENDFGMVFYSDAGDPGNFTLQFQAKTFFTGTLTEGESSSEIDVFKKDRGGIVKQRSTPVKTSLLNLYDIHYTYWYNIQGIFSIDNLTINGIRFENFEPPGKELIENSDLRNISVNLQEFATNYYTQ
jgi:hypothetical protein